ncbi:MAG: 3-keto-5-aminohexanoate cleavage protein [Pseudomonadales bacterium]|nr:3-keto-5-aminohexanoate cleavage protein [Pseudomonadales bacterium]MDG2078912.1 3-keto-5-aminohexanoate cleavage protein [Pseudomonadales bacterium]
MTTQSTQPVWLEVALNGAAGQAMQPNIPITPSAIIEQGIACAKEGASIIHLHVYDEHGQPTEDADLYTRVIEGIREQCDAIVYPTLALHGTIAERYAPIKTLAQRGLLEWAVVDPGSVNITHPIHIEASLDGLCYTNPDDHIKAGLALAEADGWRPAYAIYEPGFARLGAALAAQHSALKTPIYRLMFSDHLLFGTTPSEFALEFYAQHLKQTCPTAPWMISGLDANVEGLMPMALGLGAHLRVGLEDAPLGTTLSNDELLEQGLKAIQNSGRPLATAHEIRQYG